MQNKIVINLIIEINQKTIFFYRSENKKNYREKFKSLQKKKENF